MTGEHPFDVDAVRRAIETHHPASIAETAEVAVAALGDRLATLNRYRKALEHIEQHGFSVDSGRAGGRDVTTKEAEAIIELAARYWRNQWTPGASSQESRWTILEAARVLLNGEKGAEKAEAGRVVMCPECGRVSSVAPWCTRPICVHSFSPGTAGTPEIWDGDNADGEGRLIEESREPSWRTPGPNSWTEMVALPAPRFSAR